MENKREIASVEPDSIVEIKISGDFYYRLQALFIFLAGNLSNERVGEILDMMKNKETKDDEEAFNIETLITLLCAIEEKFKAENKIIMKEFNPIQD